MPTRRGLEGSKTRGIVTHASPAVCASQRELPHTRLLAREIRHAEPVSAQRVFVSGGSAAKACLRKRSVDLAGKGTGFSGHVVSVLKHGFHQ